MLRKTSEYSQSTESVCTGNMLRERIFAMDEFDVPKVRLCCRMTLEPGAAVGAHAHHGENEIYYILSGHGTVMVGDGRKEVGPGDATLTRDGETHDIANDGKEPLTFLAIVMS